MKHAVISEKSVLLNGIWKSYRLNTSDKDCVQTVFIRKDFRYNFFEDYYPIGINSMSKNNLYTEVILYNTKVLCIMLSIMLF